MAKSGAPRILHVISSLSTYGAESLVARLIMAMPDEFEIGVMTMYSPERSVASLLHNDILDVARRPGARNGAFFPKMVAMMRRWKPAIVHTHVHNGKYWGRLAAVTAGVGVIVHTEHNSAFAKNPVLRAANRILHARTAKIVAFSEEHAERIAAAEKVPRSKFVVIPNGVPAQSTTVSREDARASLGDDGRAIVLHVGRFEGVKNQALAVRAFAASESLRGRARLVFLGSGVEEPAVRALVAELRLEETVTFLGYRKDVPNLLRAADAVVLTSWNEAMPLAAIEAMMAATPIISVPWQGSGELFEQGALATIADSYEPEDVAIVLERSLSHPSEATVRSDAAYRRAVAKYSLVECARHHGRLYEELLTSGTSAPPIFAVT